MPPCATGASSRRPPRRPSRECHGSFQPASSCCCLLTCARPNPASRRPLDTALGQELAGQPRWQAEGIEGLPDASVPPAAIDSVAGGSSSGWWVSRPSLPRLSLVVDAAWYGDWEQPPWGLGEGNDGGGGEGGGSGGGSGGEGEGGDSGGGGVDVTSVLQGLVTADGTLRLNENCEGDWYNDQFDDPAPGVTKCVWVRFKWAAGWPGSWACLTFPWAGSVLVATAGEEAGMLVHHAAGAKRRRLASGDGSSHGEGSSGEQQQLPPHSLAASAYFCMLVAATAIAGVGASRVLQRR